MSLSLIRKDKEILLFPLISGIITILVFVSFLGIWFFANNYTFNGPDILLIILLIVFYIVSSFVVVFFNVAIIACATKRLEGGDPTFSYGISFAAGRIRQILMWALVAATVGMLIRAIRQRAGPLGQIFGILGGLAWAIATYFVIPIIAFEQVGPWEALKRSSSLLKRTWGEGLISNLGLGLIFFLLAMVGFLGFFLAIGLVIMTNSFVVFVVVALLVVAYWIGLILVGSAANAVLMAALYRYATTGKMAEGFPDESIKNPFAFPTASESLGNYPRRKFLRHV